MGGSWIVRSIIMTILLNEPIRPYGVSYTSCTYGRTIVTTVQLNLSVSIILMNKPGTITFN